MIIVSQSNFDRTRFLGTALNRSRWPVLAAICASVVSPEIASAAHCNAHFEIRYGSFKPDVPGQHFSAHHERRKGETDNEARRGAREAAQACMSALWRDRFLLQKGDPSAVPECRLDLGAAKVIRPESVASIDLKRELERAACTGDSNMKTARNATAQVFARTYGDPGCGPNLQTVESRFITDYTFDCQAIRAREGLSVKKTEVTEDEGWDRPGMDLTSFGRNSPQQCKSDCEGNPNCRSWTWVKHGVQGPGAVCWLKSGVPWAKKNDCCFSGVVR